jgi:N-methylhydantoinase A
LISMRYAGQNYEHDVKLASGPITRSNLEAVFEQFHNLHRHFYGYAISREVIELIRFQVSVVGPLVAPRLKNIAPGRLRRPSRKRPVYFRDKGYIACPIFDRNDLPAGAKLKGPAIIEEQDSTVLVHPDNVLVVNAKGVITITL